VDISRKAFPGTGTNIEQRVLTLILLKGRHGCLLPSVCCGVSDAVSSILGGVNGICGIAANSLDRVGARRHENHQEKGGGYSRYNGHGKQSLLKTDK
jgi:hypothetical protein